MLRDLLFYFGMALMGGGAGVCLVGAVVALRRMRQRKQALQQALEHDHISEDYSLTAQWGGAGDPRSDW